MLGGESVEPIPEDRRPPFYRLANELTKPELPHEAIALHPVFDDLPSLLSQRTDLKAQQDEAWKAVEARGFNSALVNRIDLDRVEADWAKASSSFWPLSVLRGKGVSKKLQAFMNAGSTAEPEIDLMLLREHRDCQDSVARNLDKISLPEALLASLEGDPESVQPMLEGARRLRDAISTTGHTLGRVGEANQQSLRPLVEAAKQLFPPGRDLEQAKAALRDNLAALALSPEAQVAVESDATALDSAIDGAVRIVESADALGVTTVKCAELLSASGEGIRAAAADCCRRAKALQNAWLEYTKLAGDTPASAESTAIASDAAEQAMRIIEARAQLKQWTSWIAARKRAQAGGLTPFAKAIQEQTIDREQAVPRFELAYARWWLPSAVDSSDVLRSFQRFRHEDALDDFRSIDDLARDAASGRALQAIYHNLPPSEEVPKKSELGLLRHQVGLQRPSKSIRALISEMPESFGKLAPCLMMSPLSIAQYLPADQAQFDVVIFDEASQIATWDAIGAIARGKQTIIVGDPKQLPPTNFFGKADSDEDDEELDFYEKDLESILDEAKASGLPTLQLNWHYRSRHESLIAFSNFNYYGNELVTFPSAASNNRGVSLTPVDGALYDRGKSRTNRLEAEAIVADAVERMQHCLDRPEEDRLTYGVVTFNEQQQSLIQDLFDQALRDDSRLEWFFADERIEPTAVKNLENVQGDERDVMYFSITFGKDAAGRFPVDFGAINRNGGERRLNVAITRARQALLVYSSFLPDELRAERSSARGVHDLKAFLEYAEKGAKALVSRTEGSVGEMESPLEEAVAAALEERGWKLDPQVGVSGFRIDLGVIHPDRPGAYLAGGECDGATYHRSAAARDRDKTRQQVLEGLGWTILRVWSPDWWYDPNTAIEALHAQLTELLDTSRSTEESASVATSEPAGPECELTPPVDFSAGSRSTAKRGGEG